MDGLFIFLIVFGNVSFISCLCDSCPNVLCLEKQLEDDRIRVASIDMNADYTIHAISAFSEGHYCSNITREGVAKYFAFKYALKKLNSNEKARKFGSFGLLVENTCYNLPVTMIQGIEIAALHREFTRCRPEFILCNHAGVTFPSPKKALAVVGSGMSYSTVPLSSLTSIYSVPQIDYSASSSTIGNKIYGNLFTTMPSDKFQVEAIVDLIRRFRWNYFMAIGSDDDYGRTGIKDMKSVLTEHRATCLVRDAYVPFNSVRTQKIIDKVLDIVERQHRAKVVVLFTYMTGLGEFILRRAKERKISRIWITSEAWNPSSLELAPDLSDQAHGIITFSLKRNRIDDFYKYMLDELKNGPECNLWLKLYLRNFHNCDPLRFDAETHEYKGLNCTVRYQQVRKHFENIVGYFENIIDAMTALEKAISSIDSYLSSRNIVEKLPSVNFINDAGREVSLAKRTPKYAIYTIDNLIFENNKYKYVKVGSWSSKKPKGKRLMLDIQKIKWAYWFTNSKNPVSVSEYPSSNCTDPCPPGTYTEETMQVCCWKCPKCYYGYTDRYGEMYCRRCKEFYHANPNRTGCIESKQKWLTLPHSGLMTVLYVSGAGVLLGLICAIIILTYWSYAKVGDDYPYITLLSLPLVVIMFSYGPINVFEPTLLTCRLQNAVFYINLMIMTSLLTVRSKYITDSIQEYADQYLHGDLKLGHFVFVGGLFAIEIACVTEWILVDDLSISKIWVGNDIYRTCQVKYTVSRLIATFLPCILSITAASCAFRERNFAHTFHEPKLLFVVSVLVSSVMLGFLPVIKHFQGHYRGVIMALMQDVHAFLFTCFMVIPRVVVTLIRRVKGKDFLKLKPKKVKKKKPKKEKERKDSFIEFMTTMQSESEKENSTYVYDRNDSQHDNEEKDIDGNINGVTSASDNENKATEKCSVDFWRPGKDGKERKKSGDYGNTVTFTDIGNENNGNENGEDLSELHVENIPQEKIEDFVDNRIEPNLLPGNAALSRNPFTQNTKL